MAETEGTGQRERRETHLDKRDRWAHRDLGGHKEFQEWRGQEEYLVSGGQWERRECVETPDCLGLKDNGEPRDHQQEGPPTFAGEGQPVQVAMELSYSTLEEQEELTINTVEEQPTISVCQMIQIISNTRVEFKAVVM